MRKEKKPVPLLMTTSTRGSLYHNGSVNQTLYFHIDRDEEMASGEPGYAAYYQDMTEHEILQAITNKFVTSQPLVVTNDKIPFMIFKSNIDLYSLKEFCKAIVQEFSFHTGKRHTAQYGVTKTMFSEIGKQSFRFSMSVPGEKLSRSEAFEELKADLEYDQNLEDQGIMVPFEIWKEEKRREKEKAEAGQEEIVEW